MTNNSKRVPAATLVKGPDRAQRLLVHHKTRSQGYEIIVGRGILATLGDEARGCLSDIARRIAVISNSKVFSLYGESLLRVFRTRGFLVSQWFLGDGERFKSLQSLEQALAFLAQNGLERTDAVVALGGGVVGDLAGFAAAVYLRGIPFIQVPTTLLAQIDASIGGKTGVNLPEGKNLVGSFHQPRVVVIDIETLRTLPQRELTAGWCEIVKQAAVGSRNLFNQTVAFMKRLQSSKASLFSSELERLIASHCAFKASIVAGDERENTGRSDARSRRILNFGHTIGHALEAVTNYRRFRHGEAVGHGVLVAGALSRSSGLLDASEFDTLREAIRLCGPLPRADDLDENAIVNALARDKKSVGANVQWVLLERLGRARIVDGREIPQRQLRAAIRAGLQKV